MAFFQNNFWVSATFPKCFDVYSMSCMSSGDGASVMCFWSVIYPSRPIRSLLIQFQSARHRIASLASSSYKTSTAGTLKVDLQAPLASLMSTERKANPKGDRNTAVTWSNC